MRLAFNVTSLGPCRLWGEGTPLDVAPAYKGRKRVLHFERATGCMGLRQQKGNATQPGYPPLAQMSSTDATAASTETPNQIEPALTAGMAAGGA